MTKRIKGSDYIIEFLIGKGIRHMFGYPGAVVCHLMDSAYKNADMSLHLNYHEQAAGFAACGYAMRNGKPCVAYANGGPGMTNLVTAIADAWYDSLPVIFIVGQVDTTAMRNEFKIRQRGIQEIPSAKIVKEITKYAEVVDSCRKLQYCMERAHREATIGRPGPVLLEIPADIQRGEIVLDDNSTDQYGDTLNGCVEAYKKNVEDALAKAERPCLLVGNGIKVSGNYFKARKVIEQLGIPIVTTLPAMDILPFSHKLYYGFVGNNGGRYSNYILGKADLIISIGCRMDVKVVGNNRGNFATNARLIRIDVDENELTYKVREDEIDIVADAGDFFDVLEGIRVPTYSDWITVCNTLKEKLYGYDFKRYHISLQRILMKADIVGTFTTDVGQHEIYTLQVLQLIEGQRIAISSGLASMGFGIPAAIGAYYESGKPSVCVCGDGGFLMNMQELQFIIRERIPVSIVVFNNFSLGMIREFQTRNFEGNCVHSIESFGYSCPDIKKIADSFGITYIRIESEEDIDNRELTFDRPQIIELIVDEPTELYPRFKRGEKVYDMVPELPGALYTELSRL